MPRFTVKIAADHTQTAHMVDVEAATPWLALEQSHARLRWLSADLYQGKMHLAHAEHFPFRRAGVWQITRPRREA